MPDVAALLDVAERSRAGDWSLRSALVRYGQAEPVRVQRLLEVVRRLDAALKPHAKALERGDDVPEAAPLLEVAAMLDAVGDRLAEWADDRATHERPDAEVDDVTSRAGARLDELGVPREEGPPRPGPGGRPRRGPARGV